MAKTLARIGLIRLPLVTAQLSDADGSGRHISTRTLHNDAVPALLGSTQNWWNSSQRLLAALRAAPCQDTDRPHAQHHALSSPLQADPRPPRNRGDGDRLTSHIASFSLAPDASSRACGQWLACSSGGTAPYVAFYAMSVAQLPLASGRLHAPPEPRTNAGSRRPTDRATGRDGSLHTPA